MLTIYILVIEHIIIHNSRYIRGFHHFMHASYTSTEAELVKDVLQQLYNFSNRLCTQKSWQACVFVQASNMVQGSMNFLN